MVPLVAVVAGGVVWRLSLNKEQPTYTLVDCIAAGTDEFKCWKKRYETIVTNDSPEAAFADMKQAYEQDNYVRRDCHQIAHVIGRSAAKRYENVVEAYNHGDNICWSGYYHGVMEGVAAKIGAVKFIEQVGTICNGAAEQERYSFYHYNCVHGLGHGLMLVKNNELFQALELCNRLSDTWEQDSCYGGVFMENVMSEINPDHDTDYIKDDDPLYPCTAVEDRYKEQCYLMQTSHALNVLGQDYKKVFELCGTVGGSYVTTCYQSIGRDVSGSTTSNVDRTRELCLLGPNAEAQEYCFIGAVKDFISYYHSDQQGLELCQSLEDAALKGTCTTTAESYYKTF